MKAIEQLPSQHIDAIFRVLLSKTAQEQQCPSEQLPIHLVLAARLEAHECYLDQQAQDKPIIRLQ